MLKISRGNRKLGKDTLILNITSATKCPSKALGLCKIPGKCYAMKAERLYPQVGPYREAQTTQWDSCSAQILADSIVDLVTKAKSNPIKYLRFSEAGDFRDQADVDKMSQIAERLAPFGVKVYGYTARKDLDFSVVHSNMVVNGSGFMIHNQFTATKSIGIQSGNGDLVCPGNCRNCHMCKQRNGLDIKVKEH